MKDVNLKVFLAIGVELIELIGKASRQGICNFMVHEICLGLNSVAEVVMYDCTTT